MSVYTTCEPFRAWCRLEPRPRAAEFDRVLKAEIHDPLWMLTRQWQFSEFVGEDTGSAVFAKVKIETSKITKFKSPYGAVVPYNEEIPLEAKVEKMPVQYDIRFRARAGQYWLKLLGKKGKEYNSKNPEVEYIHSALKKVFLEAYPFELPIIEKDVDSTRLQVAKAKLLSNKGAHQALSALEGRSPDGVLWFQEIVGGNTPRLPSKITGKKAYHSAFKSFMMEAANEFINWFKSSHEVPDNESEKCWKPSNLEYGFECGIPKSGNERNTVLSADEYYQGYLDWHAFDEKLNNNSVGLDDSELSSEEKNVKTEILTVVPSEAQFAGMPNSRWWEFEDGATDFGNLDAETTNLAKILFAEFALMYSNDWFVVPYSVPAGSFSQVKGIVITDSFGEKTLINTAAQGDANWNSWAMFNTAKIVDDDQNTGKSCLGIHIPSVVNTVLESKPLEKVEFVKDEVANMVWGIESVIPDMLGGGADGSGAAQILSSYFNNLEGDKEQETVGIPKGVGLKYELGTAVPENWIPFVPKLWPQQNRAIGLQRASMPRWFNEEFSQIRPITSILREGMHNDELTSEKLFVNSKAESQKTPYYIFEEEITNSGLLIESSWQRTRWYNGKIVCWYGRRKKKSMEERASGLTFDSVIDVD